MKKALFAVALALMAIACNNYGDNTLSQVGKIEINAATRGEVSNTAPTSEGTFTLQNLPNIEDLKVEIVGNGENLVWNTLKEFNADTSNGRTFVSAPYDITLSYGEKGAIGWSKPYFEGCASVNVPQYSLTVTANVEVTLKNSIVAIETTDNFDGYFPQSSFKVAGVEWDATKEELLFMNAGEVTINCTATRQTGSTTELQSKVTLKPTTRHTVVFDLSTAGNVVVNVKLDDQIIEVIELDIDLNKTI